MKVALVIQDLFRQGAQYVTALVARGFVQRGYEVDLVVSKVHRDLECDRPDLKPFEVPSAVRWIHLKDRKASRNVLELARYFKREKPDVVFTMSTNYDEAVGLAMWLLCEKARPKFLPVEHGAYMERSVRLSMAQRLRQWAWCRHVDLQLAVSEGVRRALVNVRHRFLEDKVFVVNNPAIDEYFWQKLSGAAQHPWLKEKGGKVFVAAGSHVAVKRYDMLIRAFARLADQSARLIIFGEGDETENYKKLIAELGVQDRVSLPGFAENLPAEIKAADAFVVSSQSESFSIVLVEALAAGTPVVSTDCPLGPPEILQHGKYGLMCTVNDPASLADALQRVLGGHAIRPPREAWEKYTLDKVMDNYECAIWRVMEERK